MISKGQLRSRPQAESTEKGTFVFNISLKKCGFHQKVFCDEEKTVWKPGLQEREKRKSD